MSWKPSDECLRVIRQLGVKEKDLNILVEKYSDLADEYTDLIVKSDNDFFQWSTIWNDGLRKNVQGLKKIGVCVSDDVISELEEEGYWKELIGNIASKAIEAYANDVVISRKALFKSIVRRRVKLPETWLAVSLWRPGRDITDVIYENNRFKNVRFDSELEFFKSRAQTMNINPQFVPRAFFYYITKEK